MVLDKTRPAIRNTLWLPQELSVGPSLSGFGLSPNPPVDTYIRREDSGRGVRELQAR